MVESPPRRIPVKNRGIGRRVGDLEVAVPLDDAVTAGYDLRLPQNIVV